MIREFSGIVRKLGKKGTVSFLQNYINHRVNENMSIADIKHLLSTYSNFRTSKSHLHHAIEKFNEMHS